MPYIAQDLIEGRSKPVTVQANEPVQKAFEKMLDNNFSQLPVVDSLFKPTGLVTSDSILRGIANLRVPIETLKVAHVIEIVDRFYKADYPIFDLLKSLNVYPAVLIVDNEGCLIGIVTNWDAAEYFRKRAIDMMMLEDFEDLLKAHILAAYSANNYFAKVDEMLLQAAINDVTNTGEQRFKDVKGALKKYLNLSGLNHSPQDQLVEEAFSKIIGRNTEAKMLDDLSQNEYKELLLHKSVWPFYGEYLGIPPESFRQLLDEVRDSRNALAHFKREISEWERQRIIYGIKFLQEIHPALSAEIHSVTGFDERGTNILVDEESSVKDSMYAPLALYLQNQPIKVDRLPMTFEAIEIVIGTKLPDSAREHRSWWANDSVSHVQSREWLKAGWRVSAINMTEGVITFSRNKDRQEEYIHFFSALLNDLREKAPFKVSDVVSPAGAHWLTAVALPYNGRKSAWLNFSFTRQKQFRVELYIDTGNTEQNKQIFDQLYQQLPEIEDTYGGPLNWERLDTRSACRIATYHAGFIADDEEKLTSLRLWGVDNMIKFALAIADRAELVIKSIVP